METSGDNPRPRNQNSLVWIIGDQFRESIILDNDKLANCWIAGGTWFIKRFLLAAMPGQQDFIRTYEAAVFHRVSTEPRAHLTFVERPCYPTSLSNQASKPLKTYRILQPSYSDGGIADEDFTFEPLKSEIQPQDFLVVEDMAMGYRTERLQEWEPFLNTAKEAYKKEQRPKIIALLGRDAPDLSQNELKRRPNNLWFRLWNDHRDHTLVVVNADLLRFSGANISRRVSWERTAQDFVTELYSRPEFKGLKDFSHLVVRFGVTAAVHCFKANGDDRYLLYYDTKAHDGTFRNVHEEGAIIGNNSVFVASLIKFLMLDDEHVRTVERIRMAIRTALPACQRLFRLGYPVPGSNRQESWLEQWPTAEVFNEELYDKNWREKLPHVALPTRTELIAHAQVPISGESWSIIKQAAPGAEMTKLARRIVFYGIDRCVSNPKSKTQFGIDIYAPIGEFGKLSTLDRDEIESFRGVYNVVRRYLSIISRDKHAQIGEHAKNLAEIPRQSPMSIAVFGPPGSGKTFAVNEIAEAIRTDLKIDPVTINMAQMSSLEALTVELRFKLPYRSRSFLSARDAFPVGIDLPETVPLIFFDEFDCRFQENLGWLKCFLGPMEHGKFYSERGYVDLTNSIFAFAGGTKHNYIDFSRETLSFGNEDRVEFERAKGPDFVSRLRGHINIKGINRANPADNVYILRRAILLRKYLGDTKLIKNGIAQVDCSVVHALLKATSYKHGARSMKALISMCVPLHDRIEKASLPSAALMNMHVDVADFRAMIEDYQKDDNDPESTFNYITS